MCHSTVHALLYYLSNYLAYPMRNAYTLSLLFLLTLPPACTALHPCSINHLSRHIQYCHSLLVNNAIQKDTGIL